MSSVSDLLALLVCENSEELGKIREWAAAKGHEVSSRGRISQVVRDTYDSAHCRHSPHAIITGHPSGWPAIAVRADSGPLCQDAGLTPRLASWD